MPRRPDTPCAGGCGRMLWSGTGSKPLGERKCRECRTRDADPVRSRLASPTESTAKMPHRGGRPWRRLRDQVLAEETHCFRCGNEVDKSLPRNQRWSASIDHVIDVADGGAPLDRSNVRLAHHGCNSAAGNARRLGREPGGISAAAERDETRFASRGRALWKAMHTTGASYTPMQMVLLEEACRIADRLDRLDAVLSGGAYDWLDLIGAKGNPDRQEIIVDKALSEARQQALALKQIVAELRQSVSASKPATGGNVLDQLAARRAARLTNTTG